MSILTYVKGLNKVLSPNFILSEFDCNCDDCKETLVDSHLVERLDKLCELKRGKVSITSGYRCANKQEQLRLAGYETAKGVSQHELGRAADITDGVTPGVELEELARAAGFESVGVGKLWIHVDMRVGHRRWTYKS